MKKLMFFLLMLVCISVSAKTVQYGTGSGSVNVTSMAGLSAGDTIAITSGTYSSASFTNLNHVTIINSGGIVTFSGQVNIGPWSYVGMDGTGGGLTYGFQFTNTSGYVLGIGSGHIADYSRITHFEIINTSQDFIHYDNTQGGTYNPADSSTLMFNHFTLDYVHLVNSGFLWYGTWSGPYPAVSVVNDLVISHLKADGLSSTTGIVWGNSLYNIDFHDWVMNGPINGSTDVGMVQGSGNGKMHSILMNSGIWGYVTRWQTLKLNGIGATYVYNNIKLYSTRYGLADLRCDAGNVGGIVGSGDAYVTNNTQLGNIDFPNNGYSTGAAVIFGHAGATYYVYNNLNLACQGGQQNSYTDFSSDPVVASNNFQSSIINGNADSLTGVLVANSPAIGKGIALAWRTEDFNHAAATLDIGAVSYGGSVIVPPPPPPPPVIVKTVFASFTPIKGITSGTAQFNWSTSSEVKMDSFYVQQSRDTLNWITLFGVKTKSTKDTVLTTQNYGPYYYSITSHTLVSHAGIAFLFVLVLLIILLNKKNRNVLSLGLVLLTFGISCTKTKVDPVQTDVQITADAFRRTGTKYYFRVKALDKSKNVVYSKSVALTL